MKKYIFLVFLVILFTNFISGQSELNTDFLQIKGNIPTKEIKAIVKNSSKSFFDYKKYCTFKDISGDPSEISLDKFKKLFAYNTKIVNDLKAIPGEPLYYEDYIEKVYNFMWENALEIEIKNPKVTEIVSDDIYYKVSINFDKYMYYELTDADKAIKLNNPNKYNLTMVLELSKSNSNSSEIVKIFCVQCKKEKPKRESITGVFGSLNYSWFSINQSNFLTSKLTNEDIVLNSGLGLSIGVDYKRNFVGGSNLFWTLGFQLETQQINMESNVDITYEQNMNYDNVVFYDRKIKIYSGSKEKFNIVKISFPIGFSKRVKRNKNNAFFGGMKIIPEYILSIKNTFSGEFDRSMIINKIEITKNQSNSSDQNCNGLNQKYSESIPLIYNSKNKKLNLKLGFYAQYMHQLKHDQSISAFIQYSFGLNSLLEPAFEVFLGENDFPGKEYNKNTSLLQTIGEKIKFSTIEIGFGYYFNYRSKGLLY